MSTATATDPLTAPPTAESVTRRHPVLRATLTSGVVAAVSTAALAGVGARAYVSGVNDSAEARRFRDWGAVGVVTDSLPPQVTCH